MAEQEFRAKMLVSRMRGKLIWRGYNDVSLISNQEDGFPDIPVNGFRNSIFISISLKGFEFSYIWNFK